LNSPLPRRAYWLTLGALFAVALGGLAIWMLGSSRHYAGTDSVAPRAAITGIPPGGKLCVPRGLFMPAGADTVRLAVSADAPSPLELMLGTPDGSRRSRIVVPAGERDADFPVRPLRRDAPVGLCVSAPRGLAGVSGTLRVAPPALLDGAPAGGAISVWYLDPGTEREAAKLDEAAERASLFRPGFAGPAMYVVLFVVMLLVAIGGIAALVRRVP